MSLRGAGLETARYARLFARFPFAVRRFVAEPLTLPEAKRLVARRLGDRSDSFLRLLRESVYGHPGSPYLPMLRRASITLEDVEQMVAAGGLDSALRELRDEEIYVTFEEFRGRRAIVRGDLTVPISPWNFDNPAASHHMTLSTGGSTGQANLVYQDLDHIAALAVNEMVALAAHGVLGAPTVHWSHMIPGSGIRFLLQRARHGERRQTWFTPAGYRDFAAWRKYTGATLYMVWWLRRLGIDVDGPHVARPPEAEVVANTVRTRLEAEGSCLLYASVSLAVRVATAALEGGYSLAGATARLMSEPLTPAKRRRIEESRMKVLAGYGSIETGAIGLGCLAPSEVDEVHLLSDAFALIDHPYEVPGSDQTVRAFNLTGLRDSVPKVMLNYQIDDHGVVARRDCGCAMAEVGYDTHLHSIRSYTKMVGEGVTLVGNDLQRVLEESLPERFGGGPLDYQLQEREDDSGLTRLLLVVSPGVPIEDESEVTRFLLERLRNSSPMADAAGSVWEGADSLRLVRREPELTARSKFQALHRG